MKKFLLRLVIAYAFSLPVFGIGTLFLDIIPAGLTCLLTGVGHGIIASIWWTYAYEETPGDVRLATAYGEAAFFGIIIITFDAIAFEVFEKTRGAYIVSPLIGGYIIGYIAWYMLRYEMLSRKTS